MEPKNGGLEDDVPFSVGSFSGSILIFQGVSHYFQGFIHPRWLFGISSIKSMFSSNDNTFFIDIKPPQHAYSDRENDGTLGMVHLILNPTYTFISSDLS